MMMRKQSAWNIFSVSELQTTRSSKSRSEIFFWTKLLACLLACLLDGLIDCLFAWLLLQELYELADPGSARSDHGMSTTWRKKVGSGSESCWWGKKGSGTWFESLGWCTYLSLLTHSLTHSLGLQNTTNTTTTTTTTTTTSSSSSSSSLSTASYGFFIN